jgi:DNA polymerase I-like protein with 3'-5' exonuclease and polymerase domains
MSIQIPEYINELDPYDAATTYREFGWIVHPLKPPDQGGKAPINLGWNDLTSESIELQTLKSDFNKGCNLGLVVNPPLVVVDLDAVDEALGHPVDQWLSGQGSLANVPRERTNRGAHLFFECHDLPNWVRENAAGVKGVPVNGVRAELFANRQNLVVSPSTHRSGHRYRWDKTGPIPKVEWSELCAWFSFPNTKTKGHGQTRGSGSAQHPFSKRFLRGLDLLGLMRDFRMLGRLVRADKHKYYVTCPWAKGHSTQSVGSNRSDTVIFNTPGRVPAFKCLHQSCSSRTLPDLLRWAEETQPSLAMRYLTKDERGSDDSARLGVSTQARVKDHEAPVGTQKLRILLPGDDRPCADFAAEMAAALALSGQFFNHSNSTVQIIPSVSNHSSASRSPSKLGRVSARALVTAVEPYVQTIALRRGTAPQEVGRSMREADARILLESRQFIDGLPRVDRILDVPTPLWNPSRSGIKFPEPGYNADECVWLDPSCPTLVDLELEEAKALLWDDLLAPPERGGFWWQDNQDRVNALARLITPFCRGLMGWKRGPLWIMTGNREGCGKDLCAHCAHVLYTGAPVVGAPLPRESDDEMRKRITSALRSGERFFHLANIKDHIRFAALEAATDNSGRWRDRLLSSNHELDLDNEMDFSLSANHATWEPDIERRSRVIRLRFLTENVNGHRYRHPDLLTWIRQNRARLLSAVAAMVRHWVAQKSPPGPTPFASFPEWGQVVAGIMVACGFPDPCCPHVETHAFGDEKTRAMKKLFVLGFQRFGESEIKQGDFQTFLEESQEVQDLFPNLDMKQTSGRSAFGRSLRSYNGRDLGGIRLQISQSSKNQSRYRFSRISEKLAVGVNGGPNSTVPPPAGGDEEGPNDRLHLFNTPNAHSQPYNKTWNSPAESSLDVPRPPVRSANDGLTACASAAASIRGAGSVAVQIIGLCKGAADSSGARDERRLCLRIPGRDPWLLDLGCASAELSDLRSALEGCRIIAHGAKKVLLWLRQAIDLHADKVFCTHTAAYLLTAGDSESADRIACRPTYLSPETAPNSAVSGGGDLHDLAIKLECLLKDANLDAVARMEFELIPKIVAMETVGIAVDRAKLIELETLSSAVVSGHTNALRQELNSPELNPSSPIQLLTALNRAGFSLNDTKERTLKSVDDETIIPLILEIRASEKTAQGARALLDAVQCDNRIHATFDPLGTVTGRFSSSSPSLHNVPRGRLRSFLTPAVGYKFIVADYSQIELRAAAAYAGETKMLRAFERRVDLHRETAAQLLGKPVGKVTDSDRQLAKAVTFGLLYGQKAKGLQSYAAQKYDIDLSIEEVRHFRERFFHIYDRLREWHVDCRKIAAKGITEVRTRLGRRRLIPNSANQWERFTALVNTPVQGGCADGMKLALLRLAERLPSDASVVSTIHDECIVEAPEAVASEICQLVKATMEEAMSEVFPEVLIEVVASVCSNWGEK